MQLIRYAIRNILRNIWLSVSSLLIIGLLVFFVHILLLVIFSTDRFITSINDRISININLQDGYDNSQIRSIEFLSGVTTSFSGVQVDYISREDALTLLTTRNPDLATLIERDANPLPNSIRLSNIDISVYSSLNVYIGRFRDILQYDKGSLDKKLLDYRSQYDRIASVVEMLHILQIAVYILLGLFVFTVAIVIYMVIHNFVFFLQDEVRIIELVGGRPSFIYGPFVIQGMLYAMIATAIATTLFIGLIALIRSQSLFADFVPFLSDFASLFTSYAWVSVPLFALLGALSAFLASWKYIHSTIGE
jgi:cell division transport system permease protein